MSMRFISRVAAPAQVLACGGAVPSHAALARGQSCCDRRMQSLSHSARVT